MSVEISVVYNLFITNYLRTNGKMWACMLQIAQVSTNQSTSWASGWQFSLLKRDLIAASVQAGHSQQHLMSYYFLAPSVGWLGNSYVENRVWDVRHDEYATKPVIQT